jgi:hypothetical protein
MTGPATLSPYRGGRTLLVRAGALGAAGLVLTAVGGAAFDAKRALFSYLVAYVYWVGIAVGALLLLGALHASSARWSVVIRRFLETVPQSLPAFVLLFVPVALGLGLLYPWTHPHGLEGVMAHAVHHKLPWLNPSFFLLRAAAYFAVWIGVAFLLRAWSVRQDEAGGIDLTVRQRRLGTGSLPFVALTFTFAAFDWMMSLDPRFFSTIFGVYWFAGSFVGIFAVTILAAAGSRADPAAFGHHLNLEHFHSLGKFLLAFVAFWAYVAFSQFMLIWIANIPEEVPWYILRIEGGWRWVGVFLALFHFLVPFFLLLSRDLKRSPRALSYVAAWLLLVHWVDLYWLVMPHLHPDGPRPWIFDLTAFVGVGGAAVAFTVLRMRGAATVPVKDPHLEDSLRYMPQ